MAFIAKYAVGKVVGDKLEDKYGPENPKYTTATDLSGRLQRVKRAPPPGLSAHDEAVLYTVRRKAWKYEWRFDCSCCCGIHVQCGTVNIWSLIPIIGDFICLLKALTLVWAARKVDGGLPWHLKIRMLLWCVVDFAIKLVPVAGDVVTAIIKPNTRNCYAVEAHLRRKGEKALKANGRAGRSQGGSAAPSVVTQPSRNGSMRYGRGEAARAAQGGAVGPEVSPVLPARVRESDARGGRFWWWRTNEEDIDEEAAVASPRRT